MQHHDAAVAGIDAVEHADVDGVEPVADPVGPDHAGRRRVVVVDPGEHGLKPEARQGRAATSK